MYQQINSKQLVMSLLQNKFSNNPFVAELIKCAESGDEQQLIKIAENCCREKGLNFTEEFNRFKRDFRPNK